MSFSPRRVVLTGIGLVTPLGLDVASFWEALCGGRSGVRRLRSFDTSALPVRFGGEVEGFDARNYIDKKDRKSLKMMVRTIQFAVAAAQLAMSDGRVDRTRLDPTRFGVVFGAGTIPGDQEDLGPAAQASADARTGTVDLHRWSAEGLPCIPPMWMLSHVPNMPACHVSILHNAQGPNNTITQTDAGALLALAEAGRVIGRDGADLMLVGGADTRINPISLVRQCLFSRLSRRNDAPERACRPFDRQRDGIVLGEGAGVFVVEELGHARRRGARIYAEVVGCGAAFGRDVSGGGLARAVRAALSAAGIQPEEVDHINAHGLSTPAADAWEARGLAAVFAGCDPRVPVFAPKSYFGSLGAGSGPVELAASVLALTHGLVPATLNYEEPDPACPVTVATAPRPVRRPYVLKVSLTEMGQCAAVVIRQWPELS
jgi:3-oxoacyl-[acyl-carrier-protein] synthase II